MICNANEFEDFYGGEGKGMKTSLLKVYDDAESFKGHGTMDDGDKPASQTHIPAGF